jgi:serine/threonine-protein kinase
LWDVSDEDGANLPAVKLLERTGHQRLDRYELVAELASGGMATVFLGRILGVGGFQRFVAIKRLHPHLAGEQEFVEMFLDEARLAASIHHPNVVPILEVGTSDRGYYLVMEYIEGDTLARLLARAATSRNRIPIPIGVRIVLDTLAGLHAAHELKDDNDLLLNLVHRDVSPQNILVGINGTARITDFGVARAATRLSSTRSGQLKGKLAYMAPEQARGGMVDRRADVFAVATVLWEVLADKRLFKGEGEADTLNRVLFEPIPRLLEVAPHVHPALDAIVMRALDRDPQKRHASAAVLADELEKSARSIQAIASVREVAEYVQKVIGQEIAQQRDIVRSWLAQSEPSRTELDDSDIVVGLTAGATSSVSSAAISIPPDLLAPAPAPDLLSEIIRARQKRRGRVWRAVLLIGVAGGGAWAFSKHGDWSAALLGTPPAPSPAPVESAHAEPAPVAPPTPAAVAAPVPPPPVSAVPPPAPMASPAPVVVPQGRSTGRPLSVQQLPQVTQSPPPPAWAPRRARPAPPPAPPADDIPKNPYR